MPSLPGHRPDLNLTQIPTHHSWKNKQAQPPMRHHECYSDYLPLSLFTLALGRWKMNGTEIKMDPDSRYRLVAGDLVISNPVKAKDAGSYQCVASNSRGTVVSREASLRFGCKFASTR